MNKIDKEWYNSLRFLSRYSRKEVEKLKEEKLEKYREHVSENMEFTLKVMKYITFNQASYNVITQNGLQQLRDLEEIRRKDLTLIASVIAVVISLVALAKSMGLI